MCHPQTPSKIALIHPSNASRLTVWDTKNKGPGMEMGNLLYTLATKCGVDDGKIFIPQNDIDHFARTKLVEEKGSHIWMVSTSPTQDHAVVVGEKTQGGAWLRPFVLASRHFLYKDVAAYINHAPIPWTLDKRKANADIAYPWWALPKTLNTQKIQSCVQKMTRIGLGYCFSTYSFDDLEKRSFLLSWSQPETLRHHYPLLNEFFQMSVMFTDKNVTDPPKSVQALLKKTFLKEGTLGLLDFLVFPEHCPTFPQTLSGSVSFYSFSAHDRLQCIRAYQEAL